MGNQNCFGQCTSSNSGGSQSASDEQYENLTEDTLPKVSAGSTKNGVIYNIMKTKTKRHSKFLNRFWTKKEVDYARFSDNKPKAVVSGIQLQNLDVNALIMVTKDKNFCYRQDITDMTSSRGSSLDLEWEHDHEYAATQSQSNLWLTTTSVNYHNNDEDDSISNISGTSLTKNSKNCRNLIKRADSNLRQPSTMVTHGDLAKIKEQRNDHYQHEKNDQMTASIQSIPSCSLSHLSTPDSLEWDANEDQLKSEHDSLELDYETKELLYEIEQLKNRVLEETGDNLKNEFNLIES